MALSGGADSAAAALVAARSGRSVRAVHVRHGFPSSELLAAAAEDVARTLDLEIRVVDVSVPAGPSLEAQARQVRLAALEAERRIDEWVVTGHTYDDQVETVLMRIVRGTGLDGLSGIYPVRPPFLRPLLGTSRAATREAATLAGLGWRDDPMNDDVRHLRNRVRTLALPALVAAFGPGVSNSLGRLADTARDEASYLDELAVAVPRYTRPGGARFVIGTLLAVPLPLARRAIRQAMTDLAPPYSPDGRVLEAVWSVVVGRRSTVDWNGLTVSRRPPFLEITAPDDRTPSRGVTFDRPGCYRFSGFTIDVHEGEGPMSLSPWIAVLAPGVHTVRAVEAGDVVAVPGGHKPVREIIAEHGITAGERWPVVVRDGKVVWIPGVKRIGWPVDADRGYLCAVATEEELWERYAP